MTLDVKLRYSFPMKHSLKKFSSSSRASSRKPYAEGHAIHQSYTEGHAVQQSYAAGHAVAHQYPAIKIAIIASILLCVASAVFATGCSLDFADYHLKATASEVSQKADAGESYLQVRYIDVGQGDSALVSCDGHHMLIDGGPPRSSQRVYTVLKNEGVNHLDAVIATHADADHIGGISAALNAASTDVCYCSVTESDTKTFESMKKYLDRQGIGITVPRIPTTFDLGSAKVSLIGPVRTFKEDNNNSIVCRIDYGASSFLFMGDAELKAERAMMQAGVDVHADMVKIGHHGSHNSTGLGFLRKVDPTYAIISVGADNDYGHPTDAVMNRLAKAGIEYWRTDQSGDIVATSDGEYIYVSPTKEKVDIEPASKDNNQAADIASKAGASAAAGDGIAKTYILNTRSHVIHNPDCASVKRMKDKNKLEFTGTIAEIQEMDDEYHPCGNCKPT